jgi:acyl-coenzyme A thioesterase PaaI-like protein
MNATDLKSSVSLRRIKWNLFLLGLFKIPLLFYVSPKIILISPDSCIVKIKLRRRTKNHLNSMYFGAMAVGADVAVGLHAFYLSELKKAKISLAFKSFNAEFLKRAESDVNFICEEGNKIIKMIEESKIEGKRVNEMIDVQAMNSSNEMVAKFTMELSLKVI